MKILCENSNLLHRSRDKATKQAIATLYLALPELAQGHKHQDRAIAPSASTYPLHTTYAQHNQTSHPPTHPATRPPNHPSASPQHFNIPTNPYISPLLNNHLTAHQANALQLPHHCTYSETKIINRGRPRAIAPKTIGVVILEG